MFLSVTTFIGGRLYHVSESSPIKKIMIIALLSLRGVSKVPRVGFQFCGGNIDEDLKDVKAHGWVAKICLSNSWSSKLEMIVVEMC